MPNTAQNTGVPSLGEPRGLLPWVAVSFLLHASLLFAITIVSVPAPQPPGSVRLVFSEPRQEPAEPEEEPEDMETHYVDIPDEAEDEGPPDEDTTRIGIADLLARQPDAEEPDDPEDETPRVEDGTQAPLFQPGEDHPFEEIVEALPPEPPGDDADMEAELRTPPDAEITPDAEPRDPVALMPPDDSEDEDDPPAAEEPDDAPVEAEEEPRPELPEGPPHIVSRPGGAPYVLAFPRRGYIQESPGDAPRAGTAQYNVRWDEYAPYYKHVFGRIEAALRVRMRLRYRRPFALDGPRAITIGFRLTPDGVFNELEILDDADLIVLASDLADGIRSASPVDPFPDFVEEEHLHIRVRCFVE